MVKRVCSLMMALVPGVSTIVTCMYACVHERERERGRKRERERERERESESERERGRKRESESLLPRA